MNPDRWLDSYRPGDFLAGRCICGHRKSAHFPTILACRKCIPCWRFDGRERRERIVLWVLWGLVCLIVAYGTIIGVLALVGR